MNEKRIEKTYDLARAAYAAHGVDTEIALATMGGLSLSLPCWQGDDVGGFETPGAALSGGGLVATGSFPGKARTVDELRRDLRQAFDLIPGPHRLNLHAIYGEFGGKKVERNEIGLEHFRGWTDWAKENKLGLDFNATCFSHPLAASGFTLSHRDAGVRRFWIEHVRACRGISAFFGRELATPCLHNLWIPDGAKEVPTDRRDYRARLREALDEIYKTSFPPALVKDSLESKLFGIGSEAFVVGSHEFYLAYALLHRKMVCLDLGHFHPTESVADKISAILLFAPGIVFHLSRGLRWDSDHVVVLDDSLSAVAEEIVRCDALDRTHLALDYFDASLNRVGAWVIGARAALKAFLFALLLPVETWRAADRSDDGFTRLALREDFKTLPAGAVWDMHCLRSDIPPAASWIPVVARYGSDVLAKR
jgi:L-rhamnose isomerase